MKLNTAYEFLCKLKFNNNRPWFKENNDEYQAAKSEFADFIDTLIPQLKAIDNSININTAKECMYRIHRDARFSKNKEPYKTNFGASITKDGRKSGNAGYYLHLEPDNSFLGGGIYHPESTVLKAIRTNIFQDASELKKIVNAPKFKKYFDVLHGAKLKTAPRGFPKDFADVELLRYKNYVSICKIDDEFWFEGDVIENILDVFKVQAKLNGYLNEIIGKEI